MSLVLQQEVYWYCNVIGAAAGKVLLIPEEIYVCVCSLLLLTNTHTPHSPYTHTHTPSLPTHTHPLSPHTHPLFPHTHTPSITTLTHSLSPHTYTHILSLSSRF